MTDPNASMYTKMSIHSKFFKAALQESPQGRRAYEVLMHQHAEIGSLKGKLEKAEHALRDLQKEFDALKIRVRNEQMQEKVR